MAGQPKKLFISKKFLNVFTDASETSGYIAGLKNNEETFCLAASLCCDYFLTGLEVLGIFYLINYDSLLENELIEICKENLNLLKVEHENPLVLFVQKNQDSVKVKGVEFSAYYNTLEKIDVVYFTHYPALLFRAVGKIPFVYESSACTDTLRENIELAVEKLRSTIGSQVVAFQLENSKFLLTHSESNNVVICNNLHQLFEDSDMADTFKRNKKSSKRKIPTNFNIMLQVTGDAAIENTVNHSLVIHCQRRFYQCISLNLPFDVLIVCLESSSVNTIYHQFLRAMQQQLRSMCECLIKYAKTMDFISPVPCHFYPDTWELPLTILLPSGKSDEDLDLYRKNLHKLLLLPLDRAMLRKSNKWNFSDVEGGYLVNPHEKLSLSGVVDGKVSVVYGRYTYHHYMQDHMDDNGWGCAYRSLQTIISWFRFQGYTEKNVPTHLEIQQALVDIGDKPKSFVGSRKWIGSQEVSFCLDHLIQVQSKIMCVSTGAEMANKGRELFLHFKEQGTPVMIGGGVLAHTIIGVDFNENTGDLKFLILDPHYTGGEDLNTIVNKGWCGWKGINFWDQNAFYNLCLPQRSLQI